MRVHSVIVCSEMRTMRSQVNVVASEKETVAQGTNQSFPDATFRRKQAYINSIPGSGRVNWYTGDREPVFWDRISFINSSNRTAIQFFLNSIQLIVDPFTPISGLTYGPSQAACDRYMNLIFNTAMAHGLIANH